MEPLKTNTCCIVVSYHPDSGLASRLLRIAPQVERIVVIDNGAAEDCRNSVDEAVRETGAELITNPTNIGLASALNQGVAWARGAGYEWLLFVDQDTIAGEDMLSGLREAYDDCEFRSELAAIGANYTDRFLGKLFYEDAAAGDVWVEAKTVITAGSLIPACMFEELGGFRDEFFIDHVDDEFCLRARASGYRVILAVRSLMEQAPGAPRWHSLFGKRLIAGHMAAVRRYYSTRNHLVLIKEYRKKENAWVRWSIEARTKEIALIVLFERKKMRKLYNVTRGIIDALRGRMGAL